MLSLRMKCELELTDRPRRQRQRPLPESNANCHAMESLPTATTARARKGNDCGDSRAHKPVITTDADLERRRTAAPVRCATPAETGLASGDGDSLCCSYSERSCRLGRTLPSSSSSLNLTTWHAQRQQVVNVRPRRSCRRPPFGTCVAAACMHFVCLALVALVSIGGAFPAPPPGSKQPGGGGAKLSTALREPVAPFLDDECNHQFSEDFSEASRLVMIVRCDVVPLYEQYARIYGQDAAKAIGGDDKVGQELAVMVAKARGFAAETLELIGLRDFCNTQNVNRLKGLKRMAAGSRMLTELYNLLAINYHGICLKEILSNLPKVPSLVRQVVDIYLSGADGMIQKRQLNLNGYGDQRDFDVDAAIQRSGPLKDVVGLTLAIGTNEKVATDFREQCKNLVIQTDTHWSVLSTMNSLLDSDDNNILWLNNAVLRSLTPTKFADICSQLSAHSS